MRDWFRYAYPVDIALCGGLTALALGIIFAIGWAIYDHSIDRGWCFAGHYHTTPGYMSVITTPTTSGGMQTIPYWIPKSTSYVCDHWEFPDGRA